MEDSTLIGMMFGDFELQSLLGKGPVGSVYYAYHSSDEVEAAIKVLPAGLLNEAMLGRFLQEARTVARLDHERIIRVYGGGQVQGLPYLLMEYVPGESLASLLQRRPRLTVDEAALIMGQVAEALDYAHKRGVRHRNIKPTNILLDGAGNAYVADFSLPSVMEAMTARTGLPYSGASAYMAPELARGDDGVTLSVDIYAMGVTLFQMLTGRLPFETSDPIEQMMMHINVPAPSPRLITPDLAPAVESVVARALAKDPRDRFARAGDLAEALKAAAQAAGEPQQAAGSTAAPGMAQGEAAAPGMRMGVQPKSRERAAVIQPELRGDPRYRYDPDRALNYLPQRERRRARRQQAHERRQRARQARRMAMQQARWPRVAMIAGLVIVAMLAAGAVIGSEVRRRTDQVLMAGVSASQTADAGTARVRATETLQAASDIAATSTQQLAEAMMTITALAPELSPTPTRPPATPVPTATPFGGSPGLVAFVGFGDGDSDIYVLDVSTGLETPITDNNVVDGGPVWSPDGRQIAYFSDQAPPGRHIFSVNVGCVLTGEGCADASRQVTTGERFNLWPVWVDTGERVVYLSNGSDGQVLRMALLNGAETDLLALAGNARLLEWWTDRGGFIYWGPGLAGDAEIMLVQPDTTAAGSRTALTRSGGEVSTLDISPDGTLAVFAQISGGVSQLYLAQTTCPAIDECVIRRLTDDRFNYLEPQFSPDGSHLVVASDRLGSYDLYILDLNGAIVRQLTNRPGNELSPTWQPSG